MLLIRRAMLGHELILILTKTRVVRLKIGMRLM
jgi:hypothetical protein